MTVTEIYTHARVAAAQARRGMAAQHSLQFIEWVVVVVIAGWGLQLVSPLSVFSSPAYRAFYLFGITETQWGCIFLAVAALAGAGLLARQPRLERWGMISAAGLFAFVAVMLAIGNFAGFGWLGQMGYVGLCWHVWRYRQW